MSGGLREYFIELRSGVRSKGVPSELASLGFERFDARLHGNTTSAVRCAGSYHMHSSDAQPPRYQRHDSKGRLRSYCTAHARAYQRRVARAALERSGTGRAGETLDDPTTLERASQQYGFRP